MIITMFIYLLIMLGIGIYFSQRMNTMQDYILGGRNLGPYVTALSAGASDMSSWLLLGLPGAVYASGLSESWIAVGLLAGMYANWLIVARRLRLFTTFYGNSLTLSEYFQKRFNDKGNSLKLSASIVMLVFFSIYISSGIVGGGKLFSYVFDTSYTLAIIIGALVVCIYTFLGGYYAVSWTDFLQGILMFLALIVAVPLIYFSLDDTSILSSSSGVIEPSKFSIWTDSMTFMGLISLLAWGLGYFGQPHILSRFMSIKNPKEIPIARRVAISWSFITLVSAIAVGFLGYAYTESTGIAVDDGERIFIIISSIIFHPVVSGVILAAILSAIMSTIDSQIIIASSVLTNDFYKSLFRKDATEKELIMVSRLAVLVVFVFAFLIALDPNSTILDIVGYAWAGLGASFGPLIILSLYSNKIGKQGATAALVTGMVTVLVWRNISGGIFDLYEIIPGFILSFLACIIVSKFEHIDEKVKSDFEQAIKES